MMPVQTPLLVARSSNESASFGLFAPQEVKAKTWEARPEFANSTQSATSASQHTLAVSLH